jgi:hypothetical protein
MPREVKMRRSTLQVLQFALSTYLRRPFLFLLVASAAVVPYDLVVVVVTQRGPFGPTHDGYSLFTPANAATVLFVAPVIAAVVAGAVLALAEGRESQAGPAVLTALGALPVVALTQLVNYLGVGLAAVLFVIPGILLGLRWCVAAVIVTMERRGLRGSLKRSGQLAAGSYLHVFGLTIAVETVAIGAAFGVSGVLGGAHSGVEALALELFTQVVVAAYAALVLVVLYFDLSARSRGHAISQETA